MLWFYIIFNSHRNVLVESSAQMAELVDALVSGTSVRKYVQVRVLFWALSKLLVLSFDC